MVAGLSLVKLEFEMDVSFTQVMALEGLDPEQLDAGQQVALGYAREHGYKFGVHVDVVSNIDPHALDVSESADQTSAMIAQAGSVICVYCEDNSQSLWKTGLKI